MAIHKFVSPSDSAGEILLDGATLTIVGTVALEAPKAVSMLTDLPPQLRIHAVEDFLEHGAATAAAVQSSAHVVLLENKVQQLTDQLTEALAVQLKAAGADSKEITAKLLTDHKEALTRLLAPLTDPNNSAGLPAVLVAMLDRANKAAMEHIGVMLQDGEAGAIGKAVKQITEELNAATETITRAIVEREALRTKSNRRGLRFEDMLANRLPILARGMGRVEHCAHTQGDKAGNAGDYRISLEALPGTETVSIAVEAKSRAGRLSANQIKTELKRARDNRDAAAGVLIAQSVESLPDGIGFGQVSDRDFYVVYDPEEGDETLVTCALYMAKVVALTTIANDHEADIDLAAATREVSIIRGLLERFSKMETCHSKIDKEVTIARTVAGDLRSDILAALRRLDSILSS